MAVSPCEEGAKAPRRGAFVQTTNDRGPDRQRRCPRPTDGPHWAAVHAVATLMKIVEVRHPLVQHKLGLMRRVDNST
ncbi:hypothetical protein ABTO37_19620, partial [Acinetobacter baumannii]